MNAADKTGAKRLEGMYFSPIRQVMEKVAKVREAGHPVISLSAGEPDFNTPNLIKEKTIEALLQNETHYAPTAAPWACAPRSPSISAGTLT